jgi:hypothetical protein
MVLVTDNFAETILVDKNPGLRSRIEFGPSRAEVTIGEPPADSVIGDGTTASVGL